MNSNRKSTGVWFTAGTLAACLLAPVGAIAQNGSTSSPVTNPLTQMDERQADEQMAEAYLRQNLGDPKEQAAYDAFHKADEPAKKIKLGNTFIAKYPSDRYSEAVYEELTQAYYDSKDLASFYSYSDKGLALFPDNVHLLALLGWVIPRAFTADEPDADKKLDKAETDAKHALDVLGKMTKPTGVTDQQFAAFKTDETAVAHSGLGLIYFRREQYDESAKELQAAVQNERNPDPTDLFILGGDLENLGQFKDAADALNRCARIAGGMQDRCKQFAADALKRASEAK